MDKRTGYIVEELFRLGAMSNQELSRHMELSPASITHLLQPLVSHGILEERPPEAYPDDILQNQQTDGQRRRRKITVYPNGKLGYVLCAEASPGGIILRKVRFDLGLTGFEQALELTGKGNPLGIIGDALAKIQAEDPDRLLAVGFTVSGLISPDGTVVLQSTYQSYLENLPLVKDLGSRLGVPIVLVNDANALSVYERFAGKAKEVQHFFNLYINQGVGLGIFTNGKLYEGHMNQAGESGHWIMDPAGAEVPGLPRGSFQSYVSEQAINIRMKQAGIDVPMGQTYEALSQKLNAKAVSAEKTLAILDDIAEKTALLCANLMNIFAPRKIYIYGPLADLGDLFLQKVRKGIGVFTASLKKSPVSEGVELSGDWKQAMYLGTAKCAIDSYIDLTVQENIGKNKIQRKKPVRLKPLFNTPQRRFSAPGLPEGR